jgi:transcriptional antiterminator RfaH
LGLIAEGFGVYLPREVHLKKLPAKLVAPKARVNREAQRIETPLMPGYLFVQVDHASQSIAKIRACWGVHSLVGVGNAPTAISGAKVWKLMEAEAKGRFDHSKPPEPAYREGDEVNITSGSFEGFAATVLAETPEGRVRVMFETALGTVKAEFEQEQVEKAA